MSRLYLSAAHKSSDKTTLSVGLCAAFAQQGLKEQPYKKGPDYIDPLWTEVGISSHEITSANISNAGGPAFCL